ncbi:X-Pro dipeptidyl-peptidase protein [Ilyonectria destructans]|nr:X-Pro dipeptidyl-peptidase protein [Ilyonectria destructans]
MDPQLRDIRIVDSTSYSYVYEQHVTVPLKSGGVIRCNVYRPRESENGQKFPVIATLGPYGKDVPYKVFNPNSFAEIDSAHQTEHSAWETPTPDYWTDHGYVVVRGDEPGIGQSPGLLNVQSTSTVQAFHDMIEWASEQSWSNGRVGLLGVSYYAGIQWPVAALNPKGLAACIPWEGFSDKYDESTRHGGILSNTFFTGWFHRQVAPNQYGLPGRAARNWCPDSIDGDLDEDDLATNRVTDPAQLHQHRYRDDPPFTEATFNFEDIKVPILSVANWGGIMLHLRGNVRGFMLAGSELKYLRFITGRHDLPFYYREEVEVQRSFLDAFLKDQDRVGWATKGAIPPVDLVVRKGNVGFNDPSAEQKFLRRQESDWPLGGTKYTPMFLTTNKELQFTKPEDIQTTNASYAAFGNETDSTIISFQSQPFGEETEITGHITAHLNISVGQDGCGNTPSDMDLFLSLRHISPDGTEVLYTGSMGEGVPVSRGSLRASLRKVNSQHSHHRPWLPHRDYHSTDVLPVLPNEVYAVDIEIWPTNVVVEVGGRLALDISSRDTAGSGFWLHTDPNDRSPETFRGTNHIHFGPQYLNYLTLPVIS